MQHTDASEDVEVDLVAEYRYNGLNQRISMHQDTDADGDVDVNDITYYFVHDDRWRVIATYHEDDDTGGTDGPKEQFIHHAAGVAGNGSYIDDVICRLKDANTAWTSASDKTLEERIYYCQNWRHDVIALIDSAGEMVEQARYEAYGTPIGMPLGDVDMDGKVDSNDKNQINTWIALGTYDVRGDLDLDGDVDSTDYNTSNNNFGTRLGRGVLSDDPDTVGSRTGYAGYVFDDKFGFEVYLANETLYNASWGRWNSRNSAGFSGSNAYNIDVPPPTQSLAFLRVDSSCDGTIFANACMNDPFVLYAYDYMNSQCGNSTRCGTWTVVCDTRPWEEGRRAVTCCETCKIWLNLSPTNPDPANCQSLAHELIHAGDLCANNDCFPGFNPVIGADCGSFGDGAGNFSCAHTVCSEMRAVALDCCNQSPPPANLRNCVLSGMPSFCGGHGSPLWLAVEPCCMPLNCNNFCPGGTIPPFDLTPCGY